MTQPPHPMLVRMGRRLRMARWAANMTQGDLAMRVGVTRSSIANIEAGRQNVGVLLLHSLARSLGTTVGVLVGDEDVVSVDG